MATSVSRINVTVGANTQQLTAGMQQASASVLRFSASTKAMQVVMQQGAFAVDDFITSFTTGGVAGGLRGAANNLTLMAGLFGGIYVQMAAIAGLGVAQLLASHFDRASKSVKDTKDNVNELSNAIERQLNILNQSRRAQERGQRTKVGTPSQAREQLKDAASEVFLIDQQIRAAKSKLDEVNARAIDPFLEDDNPYKQRLIDQKKADKKELEDQLQKLGDDRAIARAEEEVARKRLRRALDSTAPGIPGDRFGLFAGTAAASELANKLKTGGLKQTLDPFRFFGSLPGANAFGSSGAVSAINQAQIGPRNVENAQLRELQEIKRSSADVARALGGKLPIAVEVPL